MRNREHNIYAFNILKASTCQFDQSYSFLFSSLLHLESELDFGEANLNQFAEKLLFLINSSGAFRKVDRVCLALNHLGSSQVSVLSSFNSSRLSQNEMTIDYSCFVSSTSSLFNTKKSNIRTYSNIDEIIQRYEDKPVQRSLAKLKHMGIKSGVTIPLSFSNFVSGFLFLNSVEDGAFDNFQNEDYSILCLLRLVSISALNRAQFNTMNLDLSLNNVTAHEKQKTNLYKEENFCKMLGSIFAKSFKKELDIEISNQIQGNFFYSINTKVFAIIKIFEAQIEKPTKISIEINQKKDADTNLVELKIYSDLIHDVDVSLIKNLENITRQRIECSKGFISIISKLDLAHGVDYSV